MAVIDGGHPPRMDPEETRSQERDDDRKFLRRKLSPLRTQFARILDHLDHMDSGDMDRIHGILHRMETEGIKDLRAELKTIHSAEQCQLDLEREGLAEEEPEPTLGQIFRDLFRKRDLVPSA